jgi:cyclic pyranopterin phosphate synthase
MKLGSFLGGKIRQKHSCEVNVVDHCNLTCRDCNHGSPGVAERFIDPAQLYTDLSQLGRHYEPRTIKLIGGEPLLHPDLLEVARAVRMSRISRRLLLITNGLLLPRAPDELWDSINALEVSIYPNPGMPEDVIQWIRDKARKHGVEIEFLRFTQFRVQFSTRENQDENLTRRVFSTCRMANLWHCDSVHDGYFYRCPQSVYIPQLTGRENDTFEHDRVRIEDSRRFRQQLAAFRQSPEPLSACRYCLGTAGRTREHQLERKNRWGLTIEGAVEEMVDFPFLERAEDDIRLRQGCRRSFGP